MAIFAVSLQIKYLGFLFTEMFLEYSSTSLWILSKSLNLIVAKDFSKKYSKIFSSEAVRGMKLKLCMHVHDISLYINCLFYCHSPCAFIAMATKFTYTYNEKSGNWHLFLCYCRYFEKSFIEMFLELSFTSHMNFVKNADFDWLPCQHKG